MDNTQTLSCIQLHALAFSHQVQVSQSNGNRGRKANTRLTARAPEMSECCCCCCLLMAANVDWTVVRAVQANATGPHIPSRTMFNDGCYFQLPTGYTIYVDRSHCDQRDREQS